MTEVVVLGGGFAGVAVALSLRKKINTNEVKITLVDKNSYHLFTPSMYEVAASEEPQKNICIPLSEILKGAEIIRGEVQKIDKEKKEIELKDRKLNYDYLVIALGSEPEFYDIPGLSQYSIPFKALEDAVKIRNLIRDKLKEKEIVNVLVGGGGASGCEFTAELVHHIKKGLKVSLIQRSPQLVRELNMDAAKVAYKRLINKDVEICFGERITKVYENYVETDRNDDHKFDILVWAGGIRASSILKNSGFEIDEKGRLKVNESLEVSNEQNIFAAGDVVSLSSSIPQTVRVAKEEGEIAGENVARKIKGKSPVAYKFKNQIFVVPLVGKYAVVQFNNILIKGFLGWVIQQFVFLRYLLSILPITKAFKRWNKFEMYLIK